MKLCYRGKIIKLNLKSALLLMALIAVSTFSFARGTEAPSSSVEFIVDLSGSMNEMMGNESKIQVAREVVIKILDETSGSLNSGVILYSHRDKEKCDDIEIEKESNRRQIMKKLMDKKPSGKFPVSTLLNKAVERLEGNNHFLNIFLVTDGEDTCKEDLYKTVREIKEKYDYRVIINVIGLNSKKGRKNLIYAARAGYGLFQNIKYKKNIENVIKLVSHKIINSRTHLPRVVNLDDMVLIPAGEFLMGKAVNDDFNLYRVHPVHTDEFYIDRYEVTQKQYKTVMGINPSMWRGSDLPVEMVSWFDAEKYCEKAGKRLPTEAEWEKAAKAGTDDRWAGTNILEKLGEYAWLDDTVVAKNSRSGSRTHPVGQKKPNGYRIYDMSGNVTEWVADWYSGDYYKISPKDNPKGPDKGIARVLRGGNWDNHWYGVRTINRLADMPDVRYASYGFRCAKSAQ